MTARNKLLVVQAAGLGYDFLKTGAGLSRNGLVFKPMESVLPALTCPVQATLRTATLPAAHGMVANGVYLPDLRKPLFWEQSSALVAGDRIWSAARDRGRTVGLLFFQQSLGEAVDRLVSPAPIHTHGGGLVQDCYSLPASLYPDLCARLGRPFALRHYWGPLASPASSDWIAQAAAALLRDPALAPDVCFTYLPALDYDLQRFGPAHEKSRAALAALLAELDLLLDACSAAGYEMIVFGDYAIGETSRPVFPNRALRDAGLFSVRTVRGRTYPDFHASRAFAMADHEIAHVFVRDPRDLPAVRRVLSGLDGVETAADRREQEALGVAHPRSGDLFLVAAAGAWLAYPWWHEKAAAPDYAFHVDIHSKPGYDPGELFFGWPPMSTSQDTGRIRGSHGRTGKDRLACWTSTCPFDHEPVTVVELANIIRTWLENA